MEKKTLDVLYSYFKENPNWPVKHHLDSYNDFTNNKIPLIFQNKNKASVILYDKDDRKVEYHFDVYIGGKTGTKFKYCHPVIHNYETGKNKPLYPNEARLKNLTYGFDIFYDAEIEVSMYKNGKAIIDKEPLKGNWLNNNYMGNIPIMLNSNMCILSKYPKSSYELLGETAHEVGGYFIFDGSEKVIITQERKAENMLYSIEMNDSKYSMHTMIKSKSDENFDLARDNTLYLDHDGYITVCIGPRNTPLIKKSSDNRFIPLFIIFRILGIEKDEDIIKIILGEDYNDPKMRKLLNLLRPSINDPTILNYEIYDQQMAELFLEPLVSRSNVNIKNNTDNLNDFKKNKVKRLAFLYDAIYENILPHVGQDFHNKAMFLGFMVRKMLLTHIGLLPYTNRDSFMNKRFDVSGVLLASLFSRAFMRGVVYNSTRAIRTIFEFSTSEFMDTNIINLINEENIRQVFNPDAFKKYFNDDLKIGNIGYKRGVIQQLERINYYSTISQLRRVILPVGDSARVSNERRHVQTNQYGYICINESPEGGKIGLTLALALLSTITIGYSPRQLKELALKLGVIPLNTLSIVESGELCKILINGNWIGGILKPYEFVNKFKLMRRNGLINMTTSISWYTEDNEIYIYCDDGRLSRPLYIFKDNELVIKSDKIELLKNEKINFNDLLTSNLKRNDGLKTSIMDTTIYKPNIYNLDINNPVTWTKLENNMASIEYIDIKEMDNCLLSIKYNIEPNDQFIYSHVDIHPIVILGYFGLYGILLNHGQGGKYLASGASKHPRQSVSLYSTAFESRFDTSAHLAHNPEVPLIQNRFYNIINNNVYATGNNIIVAISYYSGYNQEDAFVFNKNTIDYGKFNSSYYKTYSSTEKTDSRTGTEERFYNPLFIDQVPQYPQELSGVTGGKYTYEHLDKYGFIKEGTYLKGNEILIGKYAKVKDSTGKDSFVDLSTHTKKDNVNSYVDKIFTCKTNAVGDELCKLRTCQLRIPTLGDKFASRNGQKGTIGIFLNKEDMPFSANGIVPDVIMHPTSYPTRMTLNQLFEILYGNLSAEMGFIGQANTFEPFDIDKVNEAMEANGFKYGGDEYLYDGTTGKMMPYKIFVGPIYVQRLKLMVNDKINSRTTGKRVDGIPVPGASYTTIDRAVNQGRANDGGIKIGEMERDAIIGHGISSFIYDRDMTRGDKFEVFISPISGQIVIGNEKNNIFYDNVTDGPISYHLAEGTAQGKQSILGINTLNKKQHKFYKVNIPYSTKLLIHELAGIGIGVYLKPETHKLMIDANKFADSLDVSLEAVKLDLNTTDIETKQINEFEIDEDEFKDKINDEENKLHLNEQFNIEMETQIQDANPSQSINRITAELLNNAMIPQENQEQQNDSRTAINFISPNQNNSNDINDINTDSKKLIKNINYTDLIPKQENEISDIDNSIIDEQLDSEIAEFTGENNKNKDEYNSGFEKIDFSPNDNYNKYDDDEDKIIDNTPNLEAVINQNTYIEQSEENEKQDQTGGNDEVIKEIKYVL